MGTKLRKFLIGFISLTVVLAIYLLYNTMSKAPAVDIEDTIADSNISALGGEIGKIGDVGVSALIKPRFIHRDKNKEIDRVFGFEELLHQEKGLWQVEKPYMNVYQDSFNCFISADKGEVQVETAVGKPTPKDATFTDNVVIHFLPQGGSDIKESFVYFDDVSFISDRTLFLSEGPIKFVSQDAQMLGRGLELVYNDQLKHLESLRIVELESLRLKSSKPIYPSPTKVEPKQPPESTGPQKREPSLTTTQQPAVQQPTAVQKPAIQGKNEYYRCVFSKNVVIDTPEQLIFADDELLISDILWSFRQRSPRPRSGQAGQAKSSSEKSSPPRLSQAETGRPETAEPNTVSAPDTVSDIIRAESLGEKSIRPETTEPKTVVSTPEIAVTKQSHPATAQKAFPATARSQARRRPTPKQAAVTSAETRPEELPQQGLDTVLTCDGSVVVTPMSLSSPLKSYFKTDSGLSSPSRKSSKKLEDAKGRSTLVAKNIDFNASTGDVVVTGRSQLDFYTGGMLAAEANQSAMPVTITAQKQTKFLTASNQVVFEGDCLGSMISSESNRPEKYTISAPKLTVSLSKDKAKPGIASTTGIEHFTASGGGVEIVVSSLDPAQDENDVSQRAKFTAEQIDYSASTSDIIAAGPTELTFYADDITDANSSTPLPVVITAQKQTKYLLDSQQVIFDGGCLCSMTKEDTNFQQKYNLSAATLTVNLASQESGNGSQIEHLTASGGVVRLATTKSAGEKLLSGIELKCRQFDFDDANQIFIATGQGVIKFANVVAHVPQKQTSGFSLRRPCWALFENFDRLQYYLEKNQIIVDAKTKKINIGYVPIIDGEYGQLVRATAGHVEALLYETADGQTDLAKLFASGGITFEDDKNRFDGGELFYDHKKAIMKIEASEAQPCIYNGALVKAIEYNLKTGKVRAKIAGPGIMQLK